MLKRNPNLAKLANSYLFPRINQYKKNLLKLEPDAQIISLGIGNTTEPITPHISQELANAVKKLSTIEGYSGYGDEQGFSSLRQKITQVLYQDKFSPEEVFVSDGAKCDIGRLQVLFGPNVKIAVQDPSYPVYVDGSVINGATGAFNGTLYANIIYLPCLPENNFFPDLSKAKEADVLYFCSPNNPTGAVATKSQLTDLVTFAKENHCLIVFDGAYREFIQDSSLPKSIFDIPGAKDVAIETNSFSKPIGFTGIRLGWTIVPQELQYADGTPLIQDWNRISTTLFNGASNIAQYGGLAALDDQGLQEMKDMVAFYMENASIIKNALNNQSITTFGGDNAPYIWAHFPQKKSWQVFEQILNTAHIVTTPGSGFGPSGESFIRFSAFGHRTDIQEATKRLQILKNL
jgi:LL-diaminopimelate aminotransferase